MPLICIEAVVRERHGLFGTAKGGSEREIELAVLEPRHLREPRAEGVETDDVSVHLAEA